MRVRTASATHIECVISWHHFSLHSEWWSSYCSYFNTRYCVLQDLCTPQSPIFFCSSILRPQSPVVQGFPDAVALSMPWTSWHRHYTFQAFYSHWCSYSLCMPGHWLWFTYAPFVLWRVVSCLTRNCGWALGQTSQWTSLPSSGLQLRLLYRDQNLSPGKGTHF